MKTYIFPRKDKEALICNYRHGKKFAVHQNTDGGFKRHTYFQLMQAFKYNFKSTIFSNQYRTAGANAMDDIEYTELNELGVFEFETYYMTDRWINPLTGINEIIPDYYGAVWTAAGAAVFDVTPGTPKPTGLNGNGVPIVVNRYPNHGQDIYDLTNGAMGYSYVLQEEGASNLNELLGVYQDIQDWFVSTIGKKSSVFSYRNGRNTTPNIYKSLYLSGRNSDRDVNRTYYGTSKIDGADLGRPEPLERVRIINQPIISRWVDSYISTTPGAKEAANNLIRNKINQAHDENGLYPDFSHWQTAGDNVTLEDLYKTFAEHLDAQNYRNDCWIAGYGELYQYFWFRELTERAVCTIMGEHVVVTLQWKNLDTNAGNLPDKVITDLITTPLSIEIDLTGTPLEGKDIKSTGGKMINKGGNKYIIDFPFEISRSDFKSVVLMEGVGDFYDTNQLTGSYVRTGNDLVVNTNHSTKAVLLKYANSQSKYEVVADSYSNVFSKSHRFKDLSISNQYFVGVINNFDNKILLEIL